MSTLEWLNRKKLNQNFYRSSIEKYSPYDVKSLHWNSKESQMKRFLSLSRVGNLNGSKILDIGCGTGGLLEFFDLHEIHPNYYYGIDLIPDFISVAKELYPMHHFHCGDFFETIILETFDYAICNGAFNIKVNQNYDMIKQTIEKTMPLISKSFGLTLLKDSPYYLKDKAIFHYEEQKICDLLNDLELSYEVFDDYADNDFTIIIHKKL